MMFVVYVWLMALGGAAFGWIFGFAAVELCLHRDPLPNPRQVGRLGFLCAVLGGLACGLAGWIGENLGTGLLLNLCCFIAAYVSVERYRRNLQVVIVNQNDYAPSVTRFLAQRFDSLDVNGDGIVLLKDLEAACLVAEDSAAHNLLSHAIDCFADIGHVVSSRQQVVACVTPVGGMPQVVKIETWGITRDDLASYADRFQKKYQEWL